MTFLNQICNALQTNRVRYALVGGYAVALHGAVRGTVDVDLVINWDLKTLQRTEAALIDLGLQSRLPISVGDVFHFRDEYIRERNLVAWNFCAPNDPMRCVDLIITLDLKGRRRRKVETRDGPVYILDIDDLISMKEDSGRPQDLADVDALKRIR